MNRSTPKKLFVCGILIIAALVGFKIPEYIMVTLTPSLNHRIFIYDRTFEADEIGEGSYIVFDLKTEFIPDAVQVAKRVACNEGQELCNEGRDFYCDGKYLGTAKTHTLDGREHTLFIHKGKVPANHVFCMGDHYDSYDGRYYGFINKSTIKAIVHPVL